MKIIYFALFAFAFESCNQSNSFENIILDLNIRELNERLKHTSADASEVIEVLEKVEAAKDSVYFITFLEEVVKCKWKGSNDLLEVSLESNFSKIQRLILRIKWFNEGCNCSDVHSIENNSIYQLMVSPCIIKKPSMTDTGRAVVRVNIFRFNDNPPYLVWDPESKPMDSSSDTLYYDNENSAFHFKYTSAPNKEWVKGYVYIYREDRGYYSAYPFGISLHE